MPSSYDKSLDSWSSRGKVELQSSWVTWSSLYLLVKLNSTQLEEEETSSSGLLDHSVLQSLCFTYCLAVVGGFLSLCQSPAPDGILHFHTLYYIFF